VIGWAIKEHMRADLVEDALKIAVALHGDLPNKVMALPPLRGHGFRRHVESSHTSVSIAFREGDGRDLPDGAVSALTVVTSFDPNSDCSLSCLFGRPDVNRAGEVGTC